MSTVARLSKTSKKERRYTALDARLEALRDISYRLWRNPSARFGGFLVLLTTLIAILVPLLDDYNPVKDGDLRARYAEPDCIVGWLTSQLNDSEKMPLSEMSCTHPFGADKNGRDIMRRAGHGMSVSIGVGLFVVVISLAIGATIGLVSGFLGGWVESVSMRTMDVILAFPSLLLAISLVTVAGPSLINGMVAIAITQIPTFARLTRSMAISIRNTEYVTAAKSVGASGRHIMTSHVLPNSLAPLIVQSTLLLGTAVIETAALGFLGLGQQPPHPELGKMLAESQPALASGKWWVMLFPGIIIVLIVLGFNLMGDALRDALDPRLRGTD
jgi:peptide/nickel transport system permease protein